MDQEMNNNSPDVSNELTLVEIATKVNQIESSLQYTVKQCNEFAQTVNTEMERLNLLINVHQKTISKYNLDSQTRHDNLLTLINEFKTESVNVPVMVELLC